jgi:hypothetical protein
MRYRSVIPPLLLTTFAIVILGCSKDQLVKELILGGKETLQILGGLVLLVVVLTSWVHHKVTGTLVTSVVIIGFIGYWHATHKPYTEPTAEQPHAEMKFVVISSIGNIPTFTVWIDDRDIAFANRRTASRGGFTGTLSGEGEYAVRVSTGDHEVRVRYSALQPGAVSNTREDLKSQVNCSAGETVFLLLSDLGGSISLRQLTDSDFASWAAYVQHSPEERLRNPNLLEDITRRERRTLMERLVDKKLEELGVSEDERSRLRPELIQRLEGEVPTK